MKDWYQYHVWNLTHRVQLRESRHLTYHTTALLPNSCGPMADCPFRDPKGRSYPQTQILDPSMKDWYQYQPWNLTHRVQLKKTRQLTYHTTAFLTNSCGPMVDGPFRDPKGRSFPHTQILDPSMKDWYQYQPWNLTHRVQLRESRHFTYHPMELLPNSCGPMTDGLFQYPKGQSYPHPKYWTHRWRIDINTSHGISPIASS